MGRARQPHGFTLLEIVIVLAIIGLTLFMIVPRFAAPLTADPALHAARWILNTVGVLKREAVLQQEVFTLHIDVAANRFRVTRGADPGPGKQPAELPPMTLGEGVRLVDVEVPPGVKAAAGAARIRFFPQGYSDRAVIHLADGDRRRFSFLVEPFMAGAKLLEGAKGFEE